MTRRKEAARGGRDAARIGRATVMAVAGCLLLGAGLAWLDRGSLERANHAFRQGDALEARAGYERIVSRGGDEVAAFNLGTALLPADPERAETHLREAAGAGSRAEPAARYNLGVLFLRAATGVEGDSAIVLLETAVAENRGVIRLRPEDEDARWNLAVAERMLDSIGHRPLDPEMEGTPGEDETRIDLTALVRSETGEGASGLEPETPNPGEAFGERQTPRQGARESWTTQDPGPMGPADARRLLEAARRPAEPMIRGLLWSHRPDVRWWESDAYPGGGW